MATALAITTQPTRVTAVTRQPLYLAVDVGAYDCVDLELTCTVEGTATGAQVNMYTAMQEDVDDGYVLTSTNFVPLNGTGMLASKISMKQGFLRYLRWSVDSLGGATSLTFTINGLGRIGAEAGFSPSDIANCVVWNRADLGITLQPSSTTVQVWANQAPLGSIYDLSQTISVTTQAAYHSSGGINNQAYLDFTVCGYNWSYTNASGPKTIVAVVKLMTIDGAGHTLYEIYDAGASLTCELFFDLTGYDMTSFIDGTIATNTAVGIANTLSTGLGHIHLHTYDGVGASSSVTSYTASFDGSPATVTSSGTYGSPVMNSAFGTRATGAFRLVAQVYEFIIYERVLTAAEQADLVAYLRTRYAI